MQAGLITSSVKPAEKKRQQTVASGMIKYFFDYKDWFTVAVGLPDFCSVSDWKQGQNYLRIALKTLIEQGLLIYANARELPIPQLLCINNHATAIFLQIIRLCRLYPRFLPYSEEYDKRITPHYYSATLAALSRT